MKKILLIFILLIPLNVYGLELNSKEAIIYDATNNKIVYEKNSEVKTSIASLTKIMTAITALEKINNLEETVTITNEMLKDIYWDASIAGIKPGDNLTYKDLLYALMLPSGADAAQVLAITLSGSEFYFVRDMNTLANNLGLANSHFVNSTGLDADNHYSTAKDISLLLSYSLKNKTFKEVFETREYYLKSGLLVEATIKKYHEKYGFNIDKIIGSKTGYTKSAGQCLASLIKYKNHDIIIVTIGGKGPEKIPYNLIDTLTLIEYLNNNYKIEKTVETKITNKKTNNHKIGIKNKINYKLLIFSIITLISFYYLVIPKKGKKKK